ncbi:MAG: hypothetical protein K8R86_12030 [Bacteroidales bacterium]|nr:hypothetical protein [Bacteroidales bacterium]
MKTKIIYVFVLAVLPMLLFAQGMKVQPGTKVTLNSGSTLKIINGGDLLLEDDNSSTPSFLQKGTVTFTGGGQAEVEQYLTKDTWHIVASPVNGGTIVSYKWMYLYKYLEPTAAFQYLNKPMTTPLNVGQGYFVWPYTTDPNGTFPPSPDSAVIKGTPNYQDVNFNLVYTGSSPNPGWNLVGNPFPCAIDWNNHTDWSRTNVDATIYVYDNGSGGGTSGNYRLYNWFTGIGLPVGNDGVISSTQGFWLTANNTGASVTIPASQRLHSNKSFYKNTNDEWNNLLRLQVNQESGPYGCETVILFWDEATGLFDSEYDAWYMEGHDEAPALYTVVMQDKYAINCLPSYIDYPIVPLNFFSALDGEFTISASNIESFPFDLPIWLEDKKENYFHNLKENPEYNFTSNPMEEPTRFNIHFEPPSGLEDILYSNIRIYSWQDAIYVKMPENTEGEIYVYNMIGELVDSQTALPELNILPVKQDKVYYVVKVISGQKLTTKKVYIN